MSTKPAAAVRVRSDASGSTAPVGSDASTASAGSTPGICARILLSCVRFYRTWISPALPPSCRYTPSCSQYAATAIARFGALRGTYLAVRRLATCHPLHRGGADPVPAEFSMRRSRRTRASAAPDPDVEHSPVGLFDPSLPRLTPGV
jgi:putative membrane protein insertion efficiency factor